MMNDSRPGGQATRGGQPGLCGRCTHVKVISSARGSTFYLCRLSASDPDFPRYPAIPVVACRGFARADRAPHD
jgi:hypothetical protein